MLVQPRARRVRLLTQHDHALAAGALAAAWRGPAGGAALPPVLVAATYLHDVMWRAEDAQPTLDERSGAPLGFTAFRPERRRAFTEPVLLALEGLEPEIGRLVRLHHETLGTDVEPSRALAWLRLFDRLSLHACLTPPGSLEQEHPPWLGPRASTPDGVALRLSWEGEEHLSVTPWPFAGDTLTLDLPYRDLPHGPWSSDEELRDAWHQAEVEHARIVLTG